MNTPKSSEGVSLPGHPPDFSLVLGGPVFQLLCRARLSNDALTNVRRRILAFWLLTWLPLLLLSAMEGNLLGGTATVPFLKDAEVHTKFLVVLPLLLLAELMVHRRLRPLLQQFLERKLIPENALPRFHAAMASAVRWRNSIVAELLLVALVYGVGMLIIWRQYVALGTTTWYAKASAAGPQPGWAGLWYCWVSLPILQVLLCRWYFRMFVWARLLWQISRVNLQLVPTHPDRVGGLGFLSQTAVAFCVLATAHGAVLAGYLAGRILLLGASLPQFKVEIAVLVVLVLCGVIGPLLVFSPQLMEARWKGLREYGTLAGKYASEFDAKWLRTPPPANESFLGSADIQSLADLGNSFQLVQAMRIVPINLRAAAGVVVAALLPIAPLALTVMPLEELLKKLAAILF